MFLQILNIGLSSVKIFVDEGDNVTYELLRKLYNKGE